MGSTLPARLGLPYAGMDRRHDAQSRVGIGRHSRYIAAQGGGDAEGTVDELGRLPGDVKVITLPVEWRHGWRQYILCVYLLGEGEGCDHDQSARIHVWE